MLETSVQPVVELIQVSKHYTQGQELIRAVNEASLSVQTGDFLLITGRSGSGKSTLLSLIGGLAAPTSGQVIVYGQDLQTLDDASISTLRANKLGFVFQFSCLIPTLTVLDNVRLPGLFAANNHSTEEAEKLLTWVGLSNRKNNYPSQISSGQATRAALARSLVNQPDLLLLDEPTGNLDVETEIDIMCLLRQINRDIGITIVMVTHNPEMVRFGNRHVYMEKGSLREVNLDDRTPGGRR